MAPRGSMLLLITVSVVFALVLTLRVVLQLLHVAPDQTLIAAQNSVQTLWVGTVVLERAQSRMNGGR